MRPETRYAQSGDVNIAYQVVGDGPRILVVVPGWVSNGSHPSRGSPSSTAPPGPVARAGHDWVGRSSNWRASSGSPWSAGWPGPPAPGPRGAFGALKA